MMIFLETSQLTLLRASLYSFLLTFGYVGILYLRAATRSSKEVDCSSDPNIVRERLKSVTVYTIFAVFLFVPWILIIENVYHTYYHASATLRIFWGWIVQSSEFIGWVEVIFFLIYDCLKALLLTSILFAGPLMEVLYFDPQLQAYKLTGSYIPWHKLPSVLYRDAEAILFSLAGLRRLIVGPITEEFVFRSGILAIHLASKVSIKYMVFVTPLYFGVAHLHHGYEMILEGRYQKQVIFFVVMFQFFFTTVFGWYASYLFLRMGSVWPPVFIHIFCNSLGPPHTGSVGISQLHTWIYRSLLVVGCCGFYQLFSCLTKSTNGII